MTFACACALTMAFAAQSQAAGTFTKTTLHFDTVVGPNDDQHCDIVGDLYKPDSASKKHPVPAILTTNGFGGSKDDQADLSAYEASHGYAVLSYSGLGFGGSGCKITLDDRDFDGKAGSQLVSFLGGSGQATDGTKVDYVQLDKKGSDGRHHAHDPRVGMIGGSYGGQIQYAIAGIDPRVDTIIPIITWNDLSYSLAPNNTSLTGVTYDTPGVEKFEWTSLFFGVGIMDGISGAGADPTRNVGCPNFADQACASKVQMDTTGYPDQATIDFARHASVGSFIDDIKIPTMLMQGQADTLFNLQESVATYKALRKRHVPVKLVWQSWGHSNGTPAPGEFDQEDPPSSYQGQLVLDWFGHYLKDQGPAPKMDFSYFRDWVNYDGIATKAYGHAKRYPVAKGRKLYLSGADKLVRKPAKVAAGSANFATPSLGAPTSYTETSALDQSQPVTDAPGTFAKFATKTVKKRPLRLVGSPTVTLQVSDPSVAATQAAGPGGQLVLFFKLYDVAPNGDITLPHRLISPVRVPDVTKPFKVELPGIVHKVPKGHHLELVIAGSDAAYKGNVVSSAVTVASDPAKPGVLKLPVLKRKHHRH